VKVVLASGNAGKLTELSALLTPRDFELVAQGTLGIEAAEENGCTFVENALQKARHASRESGLPALADDSGISVAALNGAPGVYSARFAGPAATDADNNARLLTELRSLGCLEVDDAPSERTSAHYYCVIILLRHPEDPTPLIATGRWDGQITGKPSGGNGFGYDPYFWLPEAGRTAADLAPEDKNRISHRGQAVAALIRQLDRRPE
jgi:XTP/dITP diphosphohydrolase